MFNLQELGNDSIEIKKLIDLETKYRILVSDSVLVLDAESLSRHSERKARIEFLLLRNGFIDCKYQTTS